MLLCLGKPPVRFLWCWLSFLFFILLLLFFINCFLCDVALHSLLLNVIPHPSVDYRWVFTSILYFQPNPWCRMIRDTFILPFPRSSYTVLPRAQQFSVGIFLPTSVFYLMLLHRHFNLRLSRPPRKPELLPWSLPGFILILETQTRPIMFVWFTVIHNLYIQKNSFLNSTKHYHVVKV